MYDFHYNYIKIKYGDKELNYSSRTPTLAYMKLKPKIFTRILTPTLRNGLTLVTTKIIIHLELKQELIVTCLECLRLRLVGSRLLNLLVRELSFTPTKCLISLKIRHVMGVKECYKKDYRECMFSRREQHQKMNIIPKKIIKLPSLLTMTNELLWLKEYTI